MNANECGGDGGEPRKRDKQYDKCISVSWIRDVVENWF